MSQTYDNNCDDCGQDRDAERRLRALWTAYRQQGENYVEAIARADRAEHTVHSLQSDNSDGWKLNFENMRALYRNLHKAASDAITDPDNPGKQETLDRFLRNNPK